MKSLFTCMKIFFISIAAVFIMSLLFIGKASATFNYQQPGRQITGLVIDTAGTPMYGVSVFAKNDSRHGTITDPNGKFVLSVEENSVIVFTMAGYDNQELTTNDSTNYTDRKSVV